MFRPQCTRCDHLNRPDSKYCTRCGAQLLLRACPSCKLPNDLTARACYACGSTMAEDLALVAGAALHEADLPGSASAEHEPGIRGTARTRASAVDFPRETAETVHGGWSGSPPASSAPSGSSGKTPDRIWSRATPILIVLTIALIGGIWYGYSGPLSDTPELRAKNNPRAARDTVATGANAAQSAAAPRKGEHEKAVAKRDGAASCSEAVVALGLCPPPRSERKD